MSLSLWDTMDLINKTTLNAKIAEMKKAAFLNGSALINDAGGNVVLPIGNLPTIPASKVSGLSAEAVNGSCVTGSYNGYDGKPRVINIGYKPKFVFIHGDLDGGGVSRETICFKLEDVSIVLAYNFISNTWDFSTNSSLLITGNGFTVGYDYTSSERTNDSSFTYYFKYYYAAIGRA